MLNWRVIFALFDKIKYISREISGAALWLRFNFLIKFAQQISFILIYLYFNEKIIIWSYGSYFDGELFGKRRHR